MAFLIRFHENYWHKERLLWGFLLGVLPEGRRVTSEVSFGCFRDDVPTLRQLRIFQAH